jgi:transposase-like protein
VQDFVIVESITRCRITRCRIGHGRLTYSYLINNEERPECIPCNSNYSIKHVLIDCVDVADVR